MQVTRANPDADRPPVSPADRKTRVFISYSRRDLVIANKLKDELNERGFDALLDTKDILPGEDWRQRLTDLIISADAVIFLVSPDSVLGTSVCDWELNETERLAKRLLPVVVRATADDDIPSRLKRLNWIIMSAEGEHASAVAALATAIDLDIVWVRQHSAMSEQAAKWESAGKPPASGLLVRGEVLSAAEKWLITKPKTAPDPTEAHRQYIQASRAYETAEIEADKAQIEKTRILQKRSGRRLAIVAVLVALGIIGLFLQQIEENRREAQTYTSLATLAQDQNEFERAMRFAVRAFPPPGSTIFTPSSSEIEGRLAGAAQMSLLKAQATEHWGVVFSVAFSPDGKKFATGSSDYSVIIRDATTTKPIATLKHRTRVRIVAWSFNSKHIATASENGEVRLWDAEQYLPIATLNLDAKRGLAWSPDSSRLLTVTNDRVAIISAVPSGTKLLTLKGSVRNASRASWTPDGDRIIATGGAYWAYEWNATTGAEIRQFKLSSKTSRLAVLSRDGKLLAQACDDFSVQLINLATMEEKVLRGHRSTIRSVTLSPDGKTLITTSSDRSVRVWDVAAGVEIAQLRGHTNTVWDAAWSPDQKHIVSVSADKSVRLFDGGAGRPDLEWKAHTGNINSLQWSKDGEHLLSASADKSAVIWNVKTGLAIKTVYAATEEIKAARWNSNESAIAIVMENGSARIVSASGGHELAALNAPRGKITDISWEPSGSRLAGSLFDQTIAVWSKDGKLIKHWPAHTGGILSIEWSPDGKFLATSSYDDTLRVWHADTGQPSLNGGWLGKAKGLTHDNTVYRGTWSPDSKRIVTASVDNTGRIWSAETGSMIAELWGHGNSINTAIFSPDNRRILTASVDGTARIWESDTGKLIAILDGFFGALQTAVFSPDWSRVAAAGSSGTIKIWDIAWTTKMFGLKLRDAVCTEKLANIQQFTEYELQDPTLTGVDRDDPWQVNPCLRRGPLSLEYYQQIFTRWTRWLRPSNGEKPKSSRDAEPPQTLPKSAAEPS